MDRRQGEQPVAVAFVPADVAFDTVDPETASFQYFFLVIGIVLQTIFIETDTVGSCGSPSGFWCRL